MKDKLEVGDLVRSTALDPCPNVITLGFVREIWEDCSPYTSLCPRYRIKWMNGGENWKWHDQVETWAKAKD